MMDDQSIQVLAVVSGLAAIICFIVLTTMKCCGQPISLELLFMPLVYLIALVLGAKANA